MAQALSKIRLYISDVLRNGVACSNPTIEFDETCFTVSCEGVSEDGRPYIEIQQLPDCDQPCVTVKVSCPLECDAGDCSTVKKFCFCDDQTDCDECQECVNGFCEDRCPEDECVDDRCVECVDDEDCFCNLVCIGNTCQCPTGLILNPETGCCVQCVDDSRCDICETCFDNYCKPKCPNACDDGGNCVECVNSGQCANRDDNRACCNDENECECCAGYCYDPIQGKCVICPECEVAEDCPECFDCVLGKCEPIVCPDGYTCRNGGCLPICDCDQPLCSRKSACIPYEGDICICEECTGNCEEGCSIGCYCNPDTNQCEPNPCDKPCTSGSDCDTGCGCDPDTNRCVPCDTLDCDPNNCDRVEGCKCYGNGCIGDPCNGPCNDANDCEGVNCGCDQSTNTCVSCDKLNCDECQNVLGCECTNGINCEPVSPCEGPCVTPADCPDGCTCYEGECTPCANFDCDNCPNGCDCNSGSCGKTQEEPCADDFTLVRNTDSGEPCDLVATLVTEECCSCPKIEVRTKLNSPVGATTVDLLGNTVVGSNLIYNIQLFKNSVLLSNTGIENELPNGGVFEVAADISWRQTSGGTTTSGTIVDYATATGNISGLDTLNVPAIAVPNIGTLTADLEVTAVNIRVSLTEDLTFPNECVYDAVEVVATFSDYTPGIVRSTTLSSDACRLPIFDWYRNTTGSGFGSSNRFLRVYANRVNSNTYNYTLRDCKDGLYSGYHYRVTSDCTCAPAPIERALFCQDVLNFAYSITECGTKLTVDNIDTPCDVNGDLTAQGCTNVPANAQVEWRLRITTEAGVEVDNTYVLPNAALVNGTMFTTTAPIIQVEFWHSQDTACKIDNTEEGGIDAPISTSCDNGGTVTVELPSTDSFSVVVDDGSNQWSKSGVNGIQEFPNVGYGKSFTVTITGGGCTSEDIVSTPAAAECCPTYSCTGTYVNGILNLAINPADGSGATTYTYKVNGATVAVNNTGSYSGAQTLPNGLNTYEIEDSNGCSCSGTLNVDNCPQTVITATVSYNSVSDEVEISNIAGGTSPYTVSIGGITRTGVTASGVNIGVGTLSSGTYPVTITDANGCVGSFNVVINKTDPCENTNLSIVFTLPYDCNSNSITVTVTGTTGTYTLTANQGTITPVGGGVFTASNLPDGDTVFTATDSDGCTKVETLNVACNCVSPIQIGTVTVECGGGDGTDHVFTFDGGVTGGDGDPTLVTISAVAGCPNPASVLAANPNVVSDGSMFVITVPSASTIAAGNPYYICVVDATGKCFATDTAIAPDCTSCTGTVTYSSFSCASDGLGPNQGGWILNPTFGGDYVGCGFVGESPATGLDVELDDVLNPSANVLVSPSGYLTVVLPAGDCVSNYSKLRVVGNVSLQSCSCAGQQAAIDVTINAPNSEPSPACDTGNCASATGCTDVDPLCGCVETTNGGGSTTCKANLWGCLTGTWC